MRTIAILSAIVALSFSSCIRFGNQDCDDAQPIIPEGAILSNPYGNCGEEGSFKVFPGQAISIGYSMDLGPSYRDLDIRWKISSDIFIDEQTDEALGTEATFPYIRNYGGSYNDMRTMSITLYPSIADNEIGKGNIQSTVESTAFNDCGESLPAKAKIEVINSGNIIQTIRPAPPVNIGFHVQAHHNNKLYFLFGKRDDLNNRDNYVYNIETREWSVLPAFIPAGTPDWDPTQNILFQSLHGDSSNEPDFSWAQINDKVYIFAAGINSLIEFDLNTETFRNIAAKPDYYGTYSRTRMVAYQNKIYLTPAETFLDFNNTNTRYIYSFDPSTLQWNEEAAVQHGLVRPATVIGNPNDRGTFSKLAYASNDNLIMLYENNQAIYFNFATKAISTGSENFMGETEAYALWGFNFNNSFCFFHKNRTGDYYLYEKSNTSIQPAFNFFACPRQGIDQIYWSRGARATVVGNTVFIGSETQGLYRVWLNE